MLELEKSCGEFVVLCKELRADRWVARRVQYPESSAAYCGWTFREWAGVLFAPRLHEKFQKMWGDVEWSAAARIEHTTVSL